MLAQRLLGAHADQPDVRRQAAAAGAARVRRWPEHRHHRLHAVESEAGTCPAAHRGVEPVGCDVAKIGWHRRHQPELAAVDLPIGEAHLRQRQASTKAAEVPQQVGVRTQHQAAAHRCRATATAAGVITEVEPQRAAQSALPVQFGADREQPTTLPGDRAIHGRARGQAPAEFNQVAGAQQAHALVAGQCNRLEIHAHLRRPRAQPVGARFAGLCKRSTRHQRRQPDQRDSPDRAHAVLHRRQRGERNGGAERRKPGMANDVNHRRWPGAPAG